MMIDNSSLCRSSNMRSATALLTAVMTNNANVLSLAISAPVTALNNGKIRARKQITHAYQKGKSYLWQAISLLSRIHNEDAFNCHQNSDNKGITKTVTPDLYQISKSFTKTVKDNIEFCTSIKRFLLLVSNQVSTENALLLMVTKKEVSTQVSTQNALYKWKPINKSLMLNREVRSKYAPKINFLMRTNLIFRHVRGKFSNMLEKVNYLTGLFSFSRQAFLTHAEKLLFSALTIASICSSKSSSKRTLFIVLLGRSYLFFSFFSCIGCYHCSNINLIGRYHFKQSYHKKQSPEVLEALSRDLTQPLIEVMIMANRYDSAHLRARQSKTTLHKKDLPNDFNMGYINCTLAKSKGRIGTLFSLLATHDAPCVFFCVNACVHPLKQFSSMVALAGHPKGWLVSSRASSSNPVNVTAQEIGTSRGDYNNHLLEDATMATVPTTLLSTQKLFKFYDLSTAQTVQTIATTERQARHNLGKQSLIFIARKPLTPTFEHSINWGGYHHAK